MYVKEVGLEGRDVVFKSHNRNKRLFFNGIEPSCFTQFGVFIIG
jgi:hypothetical protein